MDVTRTYLGLLHVLCLLILTGCQSSQGHLNKHLALFVFGDSIFDPGNNNYINTTPEFQANVWPYGESYFNPPSGRFSDGRIIPDFIAELARLPIIPAYLNPDNKEFLYGANFASAGAAVLVENQFAFAVDLKTQLQYFNDLEKHYRQKLGDVKANQLLSNAVYLFSGGSNDYQGFLRNKNGSLNHEQSVGMVIRNLTSLLKVLSRKLQDLEQELEGFMYAKYELQTEISKRMANPSKYGLKVGGERACCGIGLFREIDSCGGMREVHEFETCDNPTEYLLFDAYHPTEVVNRQLAILFWDGDSKVSSPHNFKALFQAAEAQIRTTVTTNDVDVKRGRIDIEP